MAEVHSRIPGVADKLCDICGVRGYSEHIVTCSMCNIVSEHLYCMRKQLFHRPPKWKCEFCSADFSQGQPSVKRPTKPAKVGKVKLLPLDAITGFGNKNSPTAQEKHNVSDLDCAIPAGLFSPRTLTCSISGQNFVNNKSLIALLEDGYPEVKSSASEVQIVVGKEDDLVEPLHSKTWKSSPCLFSGVASHGGLPSLVESEDHAIDVTHDDKLVVVPKSSELAGSHVLSTVTVQIPKSKLLGCRISKAHWMGDFEIVNVAAADLYDGISAFFGSRINQKAYEAAKLMPLRLKIITVKRLDVWPKIFVVDPPDNDDMALSFLPNDDERSKLKFFHLLERMNSLDLALKCQWEEIELLVFSSKMLHACSQKPNGDMYLWGVFRSLKELPRKHDESVVSPGHAPVHGKQSEGELIEEPLPEEGALNRDAERPWCSMPPDRTPVVSKSCLGKRPAAATTCNSDPLRRPPISFTLKKPQLGKNSHEYSKVVRVASDTPAEFDKSMNSEQQIFSNLPTQIALASKGPLITDRDELMEDEFDCPPGFEAYLKLDRGSGLKQSRQGAVTTKSPYAYSRDTSLWETPTDTGGFPNSLCDSIPARYSQDGGWRPWGSTDSKRNHNAQSEMAPSSQCHVNDSKSNLQASPRGWRYLGRGYSEKQEGTGYKYACKSEAAPSSSRNTHLNASPASANLRAFEPSESPPGFNIPRSRMLGQSQPVGYAHAAGSTKSNSCLGSSKPSVKRRSRWDER